MISTTGLAPAHSRPGANDAEREYVTVAQSPSSEFYVPEPDNSVISATSHFLADERLNDHTAAQYLTPWKERKGVGS
jgi:hypothetical protein